MTMPVAFATALCQTSGDRTSRRLEIARGRPLASAVEPLQDRQPAWPRLGGERALACHPIGHRMEVSL
jgi:hypothetical protein